MSRRLFAVALVLHGELAQRVHGLRAALGDTRLGDLPSHLTLVPPIDLGPEHAPQAHAALRAAARASRPFELGLGPAASFAPRTPTLHLSVTGDLGPLAELRDALRRAPWDRPDHHDFVPHVTLLQRVEPERLRAGLALLGSPLGTWSVGSLHLLERLRLEQGSIWHPVAEQPLGGPYVVGRGGVELELRTTSTVEPAAAHLAGLAVAPPLPAGDGVLVATAEAPDEPGVPLGVGIGRVGPTGAVLDHLVVAAPQRTCGIARHVLAAFCDSASRRGAAVVLTAPAQHHDGGAPGPDPAAVAEALGFGPLGAGLWCRRIGPLGELGSHR